ncbi:MAG: ATP-binding protein, partial [Candidatus Xenobia bacterium]
MLQKTDRFPSWAEELRDIFRGGTLSQFILYGNVYDVVPYRGPDGMKFYSLKEFLADVLFAPFDCVLYYNRGAGIRALRGKEEFQKFLKMLDEWTQSSYAGGSLPRDPNGAMDLFDRFIHYSKQRTIIRDGQPTIVPLRTALVIDFVQFIVPAGDYVGDRQSEMLIRMLDWASDPGLLTAEAITVLVTENLSDVARNLVENPYNAKLRLPLPTEEETLEYLRALRAQWPELESSCEVPLDLMARKLVGLTRVNIQHMVAQAVRNNRPITEEYLTKLKKELIEKACYGLLDFIESKTTLDQVAGLDAVKTWLKEDAKLIRQQQFACLPMGYLMTGRIGTGKTWLTNCWAGEVGVPFVAFKNFRDKWQGATEGNLEKIF